MLTERQLNIAWLVFKHQPIGVSEIAKLLTPKISTPSLNRELAFLKKENVISFTGKGPSTKYIVNYEGLITLYLPLEKYYENDVDNRQIFSKFNFDFFKTIEKIKLFTNEELEGLENYNIIYAKKKKELTKAEYQKEFERLTIELSWKSAQIEGNTYDLLDTEQLLRFNIPSKKNSKEEAVMLLNHKHAIEYSLTHATHFKKLSLSNIIDLHSLLTQKMGIAKNLRKRLVRITGTNYIPPENVFLIEEYLQKAIELINKRKNNFEKALLTVLLISYIQPFEDGNKRTARIMANAILLAYNLCPLSYRSVHPSDYKKAILLFYEVNNITAFKKIFIQQYQFAVNTYF